MVRLYKTKIFFHFVVIIFLVLYSIQLFSHNSDYLLTIDNILSQLTREEKIGQLFMVATIADPDYLRSSFGIDPSRYQCCDRKYIEYLIKTYHIGGIIFQQRSRVAALFEAINYYQMFNRHYNNIPLFIGQDFEWGLSMRVVDAIRFPHNIALGAVQDNKLIYTMGREIGRQCKLLGIHINFSPVVDVNTNQSNPIIGDRSFGENKELVVQKSSAMMNGLQDSGIVACAKHFPGHGDTVQDSHIMLPVISHDFERLWNVELYPFRKLIDYGIQAIMIAHLAVPTLDSQAGASSLSPIIVNTLLRDTLNFKGLIITDGLDMKAVGPDNPKGSVELKALLAGNDILLCPKHVPEAIASIKRALEQGILSEDELNKHVKIILRGKLHAMDGFEAINNYMLPQSLLSRLNTKQTRELKKSLYYQALTLVKNDCNCLPLNRGSSIAYVQIGGNKIQYFQKQLARHFSTVCYYLPLDIQQEKLGKTIEEINKDIPVVIGVMGLNRFAHKNYGISSTICTFIEKLCRRNNNHILTLFGSPYASKLFNATSTILLAYEDDVDAQFGAADVIVGSYNPRGKLPVTVSHELKVGLGFSYF